MKTLHLKNLKELPAFAAEFVKETAGKEKFAFYGKMGAGKTTLIKAICAELGATDVVNSPTFALINEYPLRPGKVIYHFDLYRIKNIEELYDIGYEDYFYSNSYLFIEWPELAEEILPEDITRVYIKEIENGERSVSIMVD
jgi:tRNA threonylcarbamoyladenosine biosynthesis protein TsaE